jgi:hypothetical protein
MPSDMDFMDDVITLRETDDISLSETMTSVRVETTTHWSAYDVRIKAFKERMDDCLPILQAYVTYTAISLLS